MSDDPTTGQPDEPEHPADKILGADWMALLGEARLTADGGWYFLRWREPPHSTR
jgi:hypothetical protein